MQKFILTSEGKFKYGDVNLHKHLLVGDEMCIGGGFYEFDYVSGRLLLSGKSYDYGTPKWYFLDTLYLPEALQGFQILYEGIDVHDLVPAIKYY
ncbi:MAG: hypothetical protein LIP09_02380 [Bacteroidales bacterium]|nr:hypothetical protein [Bacteroidales bacterium]